MRSIDTARSAEAPKIVRTGIMNKNRATKGAMSRMGDPKARAAAKARAKVAAGKKKTVQTGIMNKNRATRGAMGR